MKSFIFEGEKLFVIENQYSDHHHRLAIELVDEHNESYTMLTVNLPDQTLKEGEFFVKTWSENKAVAKSALESGLFIDTGKRVQCGFVQAQVWRYND